MKKKSMKKTILTIGLWLVPSLWTGQLKKNTFFSAWKQANDYLKKDNQ